MSNELLLGILLFALALLWARIEDIKEEVSSEDDS